MTIQTAILLTLFCTGASFVQRVCGFGFGVFIMTLLPYVMPSYGEATTLSGLLAAGQAFYILCGMHHLVSWRRLWLITLAFIVTSFFAIQYVASATESNLKMLLGIMLIILSLYFLFVCKNIKVKPTPFLQISMGALSGVMGGLFGMHGPPAVIYFLASESDKNRYLAIGQAYFLITNLIMTIFRAQNGFLTATVGISWIYSCLGIIIGTILGKMVFDKISSETLRRIIYIYMIISGIFAIWG